MFSLAGNSNADKRKHLYTFLLSNMTDEHRFQLTAKLCQEVSITVVGRTMSINKKVVVYLYANRSYIQNIDTNVVFKA